MERDEQAERFRLEMQRQQIFNTARDEQAIQLRAEIQFAEWERQQRRRDMIVAVLLLIGAGILLIGAIRWLAN
jgi:hypothetical protein